MVAYGPSGLGWQNPSDNLALVMRIVSMFGLINGRAKRPEEFFYTEGYDEL